MEGRRPSDISKKREERGKERGKGRGGERTRKGEKGSQLLGRANFILYSVFLIALSAPQPSHSVIVRAPST
jgi:hypothetical protein